MLHRLSGCISFRAALAAQRTTKGLPIHSTAPSFQWHDYVVWAENSSVVFSNPVPTAVRHSFQPYGFFFPLSGCYIRSADSKCPQSPPSLSSGCSEQLLSWRLKTEIVPLNCWTCCWTVFPVLLCKNAWYRWKQWGCCLQSTGAWAVPSLGDDLASQFLVALSASHCTAFVQWISEC